MDKQLEAVRDSIVEQMIAREREFRFEYSSLEHAEFRRRVELAFRTIIRESRINLAGDAREEVLSEVVSYFLGLGPVEKLLKDASITEIMVNGARQVYIERNGALELTDITFLDEGHLLYFIERIVSPVGRRVSEFEPYIDCRLKDGSRVNIVRSPVSAIGPVMTIRKFSHRSLSLEELIEMDAITREAADFVVACVRARLNLLICGSAGSGKTTLLNALCAKIPDEERVITIEETQELRHGRKHWVPLVTRPPTIEGKGEITARDILRNVLHMRPDRIIIGEVRSAEVLDMIQAMNTGHEGSMTTLHANTTYDALDRLEVLMLMGGSNISSEVAKRQIISAIDVVIHQSRRLDGRRGVQCISEVIKGREYKVEDIFAYAPGDGGVSTLRATGYVPRIYARLKQRSGYHNPLFDSKE